MLSASAEVCLRQGDPALRLVMEAVLESVPLDGHAKSKAGQGRA